MAIFDKIITKVFGKKSDKDLKKISPIVDEINNHYKDLDKISDQDIKNKFNLIKTNLQDKIQNSINNYKKENISQSEIEKNIDELESAYLNDHMVEVFAIVKDVARRLSNTKFKVMDTDMEWNMIPYDVQLVGGIVLHQGKISEMKTGEGKTLVSTLPIVLNAITNKGIHVVTVNDYLAQRDSEWMGILYNYLGLSVGCLLDRMPPNLRKEAYDKDITYGTNSQFGFDYLRDNMVSSSEQKVQRQHFYAIVDEVDSVLVDEARTPLIISGSIDAPINPEYSTWRNKIESLVRTQNKMVSELVNEAQELLKTDKIKAGIKLLVASKGAPKNKKLMKIFQETGIKRLVHDTESEFIREKKVSEIEEQLYFVIDENSKVTDLSEKGREYLSSSNPEYFIIPDLGDVYYDIEKKDGITKEEIIKQKQKAQQLHGERSERIHIINKLLQAFCLYEKDIEYIVQKGKVQIVDEHTGRVLHGRRYSDGLHEAIEIKESVVVGRESQTHATITIQNYFRMYKKLSGMTGTAMTEAQEFMEIYKLDVVEIPTNIPIKRLDHDDYIFRSKKEKYDAIVNKVKELCEKGQPVLVGTTSVEESEILSKKLKNSKVSHNVLNAKQHQKEADIVSRAGQAGAITIATNMAGRGTDIKLGDGIKDVGGLFILGTGRHESRRIDLQLRGRSGRQGDAGETIFYLSLEDDLMRIFGSDRIANVMDKLGIEEGEVITHSMVTKSVQRAQQKLETRNFSIRKHVLEYDMVMNRQREIIYGRRNYFLDDLEIFDEINQIMDEFIDDCIANFGNNSNSVNTWDIEGLNNELLDSLSLDISSEIENISKAELIKKSIKNNMLQIINYKQNDIGDKIFNNFIKFISLREIDKKWKEHLNAMDQMREGINLRAYGQKNPLIEYKKEGYILFEEMMFSINKEILKTLFRTNLTKVDESKIIIENKTPKNMQLSHSKISGIPQLKNQTNKGPNKNIQSPMKSNIQKKYGRNDKIKISNGSESKIIKYKKAESFLNQGWSIIE
ncbi:MAG: preprotein translocase subunit SecA [Candidatus Neomarinimicrobiota bacterium]|tara:strand:- start:7984 stop:11031 length:3048 start_codon:yes stop_codon:yes gene_type:complete